MKIILFNGPPRSGKDTCANYIAKRYNAVHMKFATPIYHGVPAMFGIDPDLWQTFYHDGKDTPRDDLMGMSPREAMIWLSEEVMKPKFGADIYGQLFIQRLRELNAPVVTISDCGFQPEQEILRKEYGADALLLVRIHRPGCSFSNDSRSYVHLDDVVSVDLYNMEGPEELYRTLDTLAEAFLEV